MIDKTKTVDGGTGDGDGQHAPAPGMTDGAGPQNKSLVRIQKPVVIRDFDDAILDTSVVAPEFYNSFSSLIVPSGDALGTLAIGVTAPHAGDGTSLVAANLAAFLAMSREARIVLVDLNVQRPTLHKTFGLPQAPGTMEGLTEPEVSVWESRISGLYVLPVGLRVMKYTELWHKPELPAQGTRPYANLGFLTSLRDLLYTLRESFDMIVVDLPPIEGPDSPAAFAKQLDGVVVVVRSGKTRQEEIDRVIFQLTENKILGFVMNRLNTDHLY